MTILNKPYTNTEYAEFAHQANQLGKTIEFDEIGNAVMVDPPAQILTEQDYINAVQTMLDNKVKERGYDNIVSVASYFNSTDEVFKQEAELAVAWRDDVWRTCYDILAEVLNGTREQPAIEELLAELPLLNWSEEE